MTEEEKQKLNEKLAPWAGFTKRIRRRKVGRFLGEEHIEAFEVWQAPHRGKWLSTNPFTDSLGACCKYFAPNLPRWELGYKYYLVGETHWAKVWAKDGIFREGYDKENPALAFCLAVEKLIDEGKKRGNV